MPPIARKPYRAPINWDFSSSLERTIPKKLRHNLLTFSPVDLADLLLVVERQVGPGLEGGIFTPPPRNLEKRQDDAKTLAILIAGDRAFATV